MRCRVRTCSEWKWHCKCLCLPKKMQNSDKWRPNAHYLNTKCTPTPHFITFTEGINHNSNFQTFGIHLKYLSISQKIRTIKIHISSWFHVGQPVATIQSARHRTTAVLRIPICCAIYIRRTVVSTGFVNTYLRVSKSKCADYLQMNEKFMNNIIRLFQKI